MGFDNKIHVLKHALGTHTFISRVQGRKLKAKHEIRIASVFRNVPIEFLRMIVVHELADLKEKEHDKAFYNTVRRHSYLGGVSPNEFEITHRRPKRPVH